MRYLKEDRYLWHFSLQCPSKSAKNIYPTKISSKNYHSSANFHQKFPDSAENTVFISVFLICWRPRLSIILINVSRTSISLLSTYMDRWRFMKLFIFSENIQWDVVFFSSTGETLSIMLGNEYVVGRWIYNDMFWITVVSSSKRRLF